MKQKTHAFFNKLFLYYLGLTGLNGSFDIHFRFICHGGNGRSSTLHYGIQCSVQANHSKQLFLHSFLLHLPFQLNL